MTQVQGMERTCVVVCCNERGRTNGAPCGTGCYATNTRCIPRMVNFVICAATRIDLIRQICRIVHHIVGCVGIASFSTLCAFPTGMMAISCVLIVVMRVWMRLCAIVAAVQRIICWCTNPAVMGNAFLRHLRRCRSCWGRGGRTCLRGRNHLRGRGWRPTLRGRGWRPTWRVLHYHLGGRTWCGRIWCPAVLGRIPRGGLRGVHNIVSRVVFSISL